MHRVDGGDAEAAAEQAVGRCGRPSSLHMAEHHEAALETGATAELGAHPLALGPVGGRTGLGPRQTQQIAGDGFEVSHSSETYNER